MDVADNSGIADDIAGVLRCGGTIRFMY